MQLNTISLSPLSESLKERLKTQIGDTIQIDTKIREGDRERIQQFEGIVIAIHKAGYNTTFTARKTFQGVGIERVILPFSPRVAGLRIIQSAQVRRAKLYYLRERQGKAARLKPVSYTHLRAHET